MPSAGALVVLSTGRQDFGILRSSLLALAEAPELDTRLWLGGMHLDPRFGRSGDLVRADGFRVERELPFLSGSAVQDAAAAVDAVGAALTADAPGALLLVGDRSETLAAGFAAALTRVPVVHLHGGEETEGAMDNAFRHALTKLSQLHLVSHEVHADRVRQMGEPTEDVVVVGAPGLDNLYRSDLPGREELEARLGGRLRDPIALVTIHPTTLASDVLAESRAVAGALDGFAGSVVVTGTNADVGGEAIARFWREWTAAHGAIMVAALGEGFYWGLLRQAAVVIGNSSSGLIEAPAAGASVVNVGDRQRGRVRATGIADLPADAGEVRRAVAAAVSPEGRAQARSRAPVYPAGAAAPRVVDAIRGWWPRRTLRKRFVDRGA